MKTLPAKRVREILRDVWPELKHIWIFDKKLVLLSSFVMEKILAEISIKEMIFKDETFDCDDFALVMNAQIKLQAASMGLPHSLTFGEAVMIHPLAGVHCQNVYITATPEVYLYEPQSGQRITPGQGETVFYVRM